MAIYVPEGREPPYYVDSRGWRESKNGPIYPTLEEANRARRMKGNPYYSSLTKEANISTIWIIIFMLVLIIFAVIVI